MSQHTHKRDQVAEGTKESSAQPGSHSLRSVARQKGCTYTATWETRQTVARRIRDRYGYRYSLVVVKQTNTVVGQLTDFNNS